MANDYFRFRQFTIRQDRCAMKVGTDGTLLGAWARGGRHILDVGTGTALVALMMAQRFPDARVIGVDIEPAAISQAYENVEASPFASRVGVLCQDACLFDSDEPFDAIVSNPPYYDRSMTCPDARRTVARHTTTLSYRQLLGIAHRLLSDRGELSVIVPAECRGQLESEALLCGFFPARRCVVKTTPRKQPRRFLLSFRRHPVASVQDEEGIIELAPGLRAPWYVELTKDFYL